MINPKQYLTSIETNTPIELEYNKTTTTALNVEKSLISNSNKTKRKQLNTNLCTKRNIKIHLLNKHTSIYIADNYGETTGEKVQTAIENIAATIIQRFFKKVLAASSYRYMFSNGQVFQKASTTTNKYKHFAKYHSNDNSKNFSSLESMQKFSTLCLQEIKNKLGDLSSTERIFIKRITYLGMIFMHRSFDKLIKNNTKGKKQVTIYSNKILQEKKIKVLKTSTELADKQQLANNDFVFCTPYFNYSSDSANTINDVVRPDIATLTCRYGIHSYFFEEKQFPYFYLTLTDHFFSKVFVYRRLPLLNNFYDYIRRSIIGFETIKKHTYFPMLPYFSTFTYNDSPIFTYNDTPMFTQKDMRLAIAYYTIDFLRSLDYSREHHEIRHKILNANPKEFNRIFHAIFNPEIHIPKILVLDNPKEFTNCRHGLHYLNIPAPACVPNNVQPHCI